MSNSGGKPLKSTGVGMDLVQGGGRRDGEWGGGDLDACSTVADVSVVSTKYRSKSRRSFEVVVSLKFLLEREEDETWAEVSKSGSSGGGGSSGSSSSS